MTVDVTFLGTGTSHGVPVIGCSCPVCTSSDPRDQRYRSSILIQTEGRDILVDTGPEFRLQAIRAGIKRLDAVLYTHDHADHLHGIDDLRVFTHVATLPVYGNRRLVDCIADRFGYVLGRCEFAGGLPHVETHLFEGSEPMDIAGVEVQPVPIRHGDLTINGYRIGPFAYLTDCSGIPEASWGLLEDLDILVIGALRRAPHPTHFSIGQAVEAALRVGARQTYLTHLSHDELHGTLEASLPDSVHVAYDTLHVRAIG
ncbi:MAG: MBL fold metallo-hydrolase [Sphaerochaetaceae bacterium]|jgi:phosphoribosyl 1,2-cyclic phosphate phosphodiesterase